MLKILGPLQADRRTGGQTGTWKPLYGFTWRVPLLRVSFGTSFEDTGMFVDDDQHARWLACFGMTYACAKTPTEANASQFSMAKYFA